MQQSGRKTDGSGPVRLWSFAYSRRIFGLVIVVLAVGLVGRCMLVPPGFGKTGHYRAQAPAEEAARTPQHQGKKVCAECHTGEFDAHEKDVHVTVECEDCHGMGALHVAARGEGAPESKGRLFRKLEQANCLTCHGRLLARPKLFPTVDVAEHFAQVGVTDKTTPCQACHSPHEPLFLETRVAKARIHPLIHPCSDCHLDAKIKERPRPEDHVVTFECKDCHADLVADFEQKPHKVLGCQACHPFRKDSDFSGRILKSGSPRFCLMCHEDKPFKNGGKIRHIASFESHRADMAASEEDKQKRCVDCHGNGDLHAMKATTAAPPAAQPGAQDAASR